MFGLRAAGEGGGGIGKSGVGGGRRDVGKEMESPGGGRDEEKGGTDLFGISRLGAHSHSWWQGRDDIHPQYQVVMGRRCGPFDLLLSTNNAFEWILLHKKDKKRQMYLFA